MYATYEQAVEMSPGSLLVHAYGAGAAVAEQRADDQDAARVLAALKDRIQQERPFVAGFTRAPELRAGSAFAKGGETGSLALSGLLHETMRAVAPSEQLSGADVLNLIDQLSEDIDRATDGNLESARRVDNFLAAASEVAISWVGPDAPMD